MLLSFCILGPRRKLKTVSNAEDSAAFPPTILFIICVRAELSPARFRTSSLYNPFAGLPSSHSLLCVFYTPATVINSVNYCCMEGSAEVPAMVYTVYVCVCVCSRACLVHNPSCISSALCFTCDLHQSRRCRQDKMFRDAAINSGTLNALDLRLSLKCIWKLQLA